MRKLSIFPVNVASKAALLAILFLSCSATTFSGQDNDLTTARSLLKQHKTAEAILLLKQLAARQPVPQGINHELGVAYYREGEYLDAAQYLQNAWKENPQDHDAAQLLGLSYYSSGRPAEAIPALEAFRSWSSNQNVDAVYILGLCYVMTKRYTEARQTFAHLYAVKEDSAAAHLILGRMLLRQGFDPAAQSEINAALVISPQLPLAHLTLGEIDVYGGDYLKAMREFQAELALDPTCTAALTHLGDVYWRLQRDDESQQVLRRSISLDSGASEPYVVLGKVLLRAGQPNLAEKNLQRAIHLDSSNYTAHYFLAQVYREQGKLESAQVEMKTAARIQQSQPANARRN
jgi:tetratricopeptide (TPR) repeat protein